MWGFKNRTCFVCGPDNSSGLRCHFDFDAQRIEAKARMAIPRQFQGIEGIVHGGIISALLDESAIYACSGYGEKFVTAELAVRFRRPVPVETEVVIVGRVTGVSRRVYLVESRMEIEGELMAKADVKVFPL